MSEYEYLPDIYSILFRSLVLDAWVKDSLVTELL